MSLIHTPDKILEGGADGTGLLAIFEQMADEAKERGEHTDHLVVSFMQKGDDFKVGTWVAELHLVVTEVVDE